MLSQQRESIDVPIVFDRWNRGLQQNVWHDLLFGKRLVAGFRPVCRNSIAGRRAGNCLQQRERALHNTLRSRPCHARVGQVANYQGIRGYFDAEKQKIGRDKIVWRPDLVILFALSISAAHL